MHDQQGERQFVINELAALLADADYMATLVVRFLKSEGYTATTPSAASDTPSLEPDSPAVRRWKAYLLNLAAAIRFAVWERAGLIGEIVEDLPPAAHVLCNALPSEGSDIVADWHPEPFKQMRRIWQRQMVHHSRIQIDADILLKPEVGRDEFVGSLVEFLWKHRHVVRRGEENEGATEE